MIIEETHPYLFKAGRPIDKYVCFWDETRNATSYYVWNGNEYVIQETPAKGIIKAQDWMAENFPCYKEDHPDFYKVQK